jgi:sulfate adenylyltransferase
MTKPRIELRGRALADVACITEGVFAPIEGFMGRDDYRRVLTDMRLASGRLWSLPVCLPVDEDAASSLRGHESADLTSDGRPVATIDIDDIYGYDKEREAQLAFGTIEDAHPGVAALRAQGDRYVSGRVTATAPLYSEDDPFAEYRMTPARVREQMAALGWRTMVGFQTRNPVHRAHEYLQKCALESCDGLLLNPLVGETKSDDVPAEVRMRCYRVLLDGYYPSAHVMLVVFPAAMRYAGPREAVFHALCRRNYGCTHFIVGRDHAGVGKYYGPYDAHELLRSLDPADLQIQPLFYENSFWCWDCEGMASSKTCPHGDDRRVILSGTQVREMLSRGEEPPPEFSRPEVARVLIDFYRGAR